MAIFDNDDTITAIATPMGQGGIGIIRVSGPQSLTILQEIFKASSEKFVGFRPWTLHHGTIVDGDEALDDVLAVFMPGPKTFTGEDVAEVHCHGGSGVMSAVLETIMARGARLAERGEFTRRAFLNGRMDLTQAEAVAEMIAAPSREGLRLAKAKLEGMLGERVLELRGRLDTARVQLSLAVDFPDEEVECLAPDEFLELIRYVKDGIGTLATSYDRTRCWQDGAMVVLAGQVNAGKSSLMNALLGRKRAIVTDQAGTTRDFIEEPLNLNGLAIRLVDTAGLRETGDIVEQEGVRMSRDLVGQADLVVLVVDSATVVEHKGLPHAEQELIRHAQEQGNGHVLIACNKADSVENAVGDLTMPTAFDGTPCVAVSAKSGYQMDILATAIRQEILSIAGATEPEAGELAPNLRQAEALRRAMSELELLDADIVAGIPYDLCGVRLELACSALADVTGESTPDAILNSIFSSFCIGK
ncbi:MAG: tRNA uridine-5-carboxymethylaminomethyl(34) synthesis GTPase MnmE [Pseudomonadota bacterium]